MIYANIPGMTEQVKDNDEQTTNNKLTTRMTTSGQCKSNDINGGDRCWAVTMSCHMVNGWSIWHTRTLKVQH